ncbi:MAG TPA: FtsX-like permease family protein, partial [Candidatus Krumholzibacterium sp.]|nr:FtsX-like permease family protein [Candidatus Krumholzibacterium sp.]
LPIRDDDVVEKAQTLREELVAIPGVRSGSVAQMFPGMNNMNSSVYVPEGWEADQTVLVQNFSVDDGFIETLDIELAAGRNFSREFSTDPGQAVLVNETAVREFGWSGDPVGKKIYYGEGDDIDFDLGGYYTVVGVMKDFHLRSLQHRVEPLMIDYSSDNANRLALKIDTQDIPAILSGIEAKWKSVAGGSAPFDYFFLDDFFDGLYRSEERLGRIFRVFTVFAVFIGCLGLFGLVSFAAERRTREIGIRKVLGSSSGGIVTMLCREFVLLVLIANLVAWPMAYLLMKRWLQAFPYQSGISPMIFLLAGLMAVVIAVLTVSYRAVRAANTNPIEALRYE